MPSKRQLAAVTWVIFSFTVWLQPWFAGTNAFFTTQDQITSNTISTGCWLPPTIPELLSPADGTVATLGSPWELNPVMDWMESSSECDGATIQYQYESYHDAGLTSLAYRSAWLNNSLIPAPGTPDGDYYWRVRARDQWGHQSDFSAPWLLTVDRSRPYQQPGNLEIVKYNCPAETPISNAHRPSSTGERLVPEGCEVAGGYEFGAIHQADKTDLSAPYPGLTNNDPFTSLGVTNESGVLLVTATPSEGRYMLAELDDEGDRLGDEFVQGFLCTGDAGTFTNNYEATFVPVNGTAYCSVFNVLPPAPLRMSMLAGPESAPPADEPATASDSAATSPVVTQRDQHLQVRFLPDHAFTSVEYYLKYTHLVDGLPVQEMIEGEDNKLPDTELLVELYLGTCSTGGVTCVLHLDVSDLELGLLYKNGTELLGNETLTPSWDTTL